MSLVPLVVGVGILELRVVLSGLYEYSVVFVGVSWYYMT